MTIPGPNVAESIEAPPTPAAAVAESEPEIIVEALPESLQGELDGVEKRDRKRGRPRKQPRGSR